MLLVGARIAALPPGSATEVGGIGQGGAAMKRPSQAKLESICRKWNEQHPIGTEVRYHSVIGEPEHIVTKTRCHSFVLSGHTPAIFVENISGCVCLEAVVAL